MAKRRQQIGFPRAVLLVELERRCADERCNAKNRIGLTKAEARAYRGFACARCERWHDDTLTERDVPDWWEELTVTGLAALRPPAAHEVGRADEWAADGAGEVVARLSAAWRETQALPDDDSAAEERDAEARAS
jgi:hypothetical protein